MKKRSYYSIGGKNTESGRSLTEMMGTLAIMGILAIAGIWMYNSAMDKLKANTLINEAQKRAVVVASQIGFQGRTDPSLGEFSDNTFSGGTFSTNVVTEGLYQQFGIQVSGVSKNVCQNILNTIGNETPVRRLSLISSPRETLTTCADNNTLLMIYNNNMSTQNGDPLYSCDTDNDCSICGTCVTHVCENECAIPAPSGGCDFDNECNQGNACLVCNTETNQCENGCKKVEYLESTGSQWIDTEVNADSSLGIETKYALTSTNAGQRWGAIYSNNGLIKRHHFNMDTGDVSYYIDTTNNKNSIPRDLDDHFLTIDPISHKQTIDGSQYSISAASFDTGLTYWLFKRHSNDATLQSNINVKLYNFKMYRSASMIRDFIPVLVPQGNNTFKPAMLDKVEQKVYYNQGTGTDFSYGSVID